MRVAWLCCSLLSVGFLAASAPVQGAQPDTRAIYQGLEKLESVELPAAVTAVGHRYDAYLSARRRAENERSTRAWQAIKSQADWEKHRDGALAELYRWHGGPPKETPVEVQDMAPSIAGEGFSIRRLLITGGPTGITANLYVPEKLPPEGAPGIVISHSHHTPKADGELQDMGMTWARAGCYVLVPDHLGHGERRQHPYVTAADYGAEFRVSRQDYFFRYNLAITLHLAGESLARWMADDLSRGVSALLAQPGIDERRIVLLGSVAGGGDPAALAAALDRRIDCVAPFNFGGPQPESTYPLPDDAEQTFNYGGGGSWESTRNLHHSYSGGFLPWVIVGSVAPRRVIHAHEFRWDRERDPVFKRYEQIYRWYQAPQFLAFAHGRGGLSGRPPEATHCNHIGAEHRWMIHPPLTRWFGIVAPEYSQRLPATDLVCLRTPKAQSQLTPARQAIAELVKTRLTEKRKEWSELDLAARRKTLRQEWTRILGPVEPGDAPFEKRHTEEFTGGQAEYCALVREQAADKPPEKPTVTAWLLIPDAKAAGQEKDKRPVVLGVTQLGKDLFLQRRRRDIALLLTKGVAICLLDLPATAEKPADDRGRRSAATGQAATALMLGESTLGIQVADLRQCLRWLRRDPRFDPQRVALWGETLMPANTPDITFRMPHDAPPLDGLPRSAEPVGALAVLLAGLFEEDVAAIYGHGGLVSWQSVFTTPFTYLPYDVVVPGVLQCGDWDDLTALQTARGVSLVGIVDGNNRPVAPLDLDENYAGARRTLGERLTLSEETPRDGAAATWLAEQLLRAR